MIVTIYRVTSWCNMISSLLILGESRCWKPPGPKAPSTVRLRPLRVLLCALLLSWVGFGPVGTSVQLRGERIQIQGRILLPDVQSRYWRKKRGCQFFRTEAPLFSERKCGRVCCCPKITSTFWLDVKKLRTNKQHTNSCLIRYKHFFFWFIYKHFFSFVSDAFKSCRNFRLRSKNTISTFTNQSQWSCWTLFFTAAGL